MRPTGPVVPVYPTWAQFARLPRARARWREWFPFDAAGGAWTFSGRVALYHGLPSLGLPARSTILVPSYHQGVEIDALLHGRKLIEDCALSLFSRENDTWLGSVGDLALFSVYKTLPLPHGGFLVTKPPRAAAALRPAPGAATLAQTLDLMHQGVEASAWWRLEKWWTWASRRAPGMIQWQRDEMVASGGARWDSRLLDYGASPWVAPLMRLMDRDAVVARRRENYERLASRLRGHVSLPFPELRAGTCPLFFPVMVPEKVRFQRALEQLGVQSVNLWDASHPTCPPALAAEVAAWRAHCLELPIHQELGADQVDRVAAAVVDVVDSAVEGDSRRRRRA